MVKSTKNSAVKLIQSTKIYEDKDVVLRLYVNLIVK